MKHIRILLAALGCLCFLTTALHAQVPQIINYQGRVTVGATNFNGTGSFKFALVQGAGPTLLWKNDGSAGDTEPATAVSLTVTKGLYSVLLGGAGTPIAASVFANDDVRLRVWFNDGTNGSQLVSPDQRLAAVGYAMVAAGLPNVTSSGGLYTVLSVSSYFGGVRSVGDGGSFSLWDAGNAERGTLAIPQSGGQYSADAAGNDVVLRAVTGNLLLQSGAGGAAIYVKTDNNVGIGTATPFNKLDVANGGIIGNNSGGTGSSVDNSARGVKVGFGFQSAAGAGGDFLGMKSEILPSLLNSAVNDGDLEFFTWANNITNSREVMRIKGNGNVGIGTATPSTKLQVAGTVTAAAFVGDGSGLTNVPASALVGNLNPKKVALLKWWQATQANNRFPAGSTPHGICFTGAHIWVTNSNSNTVTAVDASSGQYITTISVGQDPQGICCDGSSIWVANGNSNNVTKIRLTDGAVLGTYSAGASPTGICFDGSSIWVSNRSSDSVTKLNANNGAVLGTYSVGDNPSGICFDGSSIWVSNNSSDTVTKLNANNGAVLGTYSVDNAPTGICFDGSSIWVANYGSASGTVMKLNASTGAVLGTYSIVGQYPQAICFDGSSIWVPSFFDGSVTKLDARTGAFQGTFAAGSGAYGICFDGSSIWVTNYYEDTVTKL